MCSNLFYKTVAEKTCSKGMVFFFSALFIFLGGVFGGVAGSMFWGATFGPLGNVVLLPITIYPAAEYLN